MKHFSHFQRCMTCTSLYLVFGSISHVNQTSTPCHHEQHVCNLHKLRTGTAPTNVSGSRRAITLIVPFYGRHPSPKRDVVPEILMQHIHSAQTPRIWSNVRG